MNLIGNINAIPFRRFRGGSGATPPFPSIPGMIARYSALGLTNEQMKENPVWVDKTGNGNDLQLKNFAWGGMSGVGGYSDNFSSDSWKKPSDVSVITWTNSSFNIAQVMNLGVNIYYRAKGNDPESVIPERRINVKGLEGGQILRYLNAGNKIIEISQDGIYTIPSFTFRGASSYHGYSLAKKQESCNVTVEQLPLYPGALVFDGVDDYGTCDNFPILTKEKGYTVVALRQWIEEKNSVTALASNSKNWNQDGAFVFEYNNLENNYPNIEISFGSNNVFDRGLSPYSYQTSKSYNGNLIESGSFLGSDKLVVAKANENLSPNSNIAIWELVFLDHDATEEELTKIKDYFVKTYPWLFPDQAWTVTGKTNEDEDRATIANITGNSNDLVLSNFGFVEGSGYNEEGEYAGYLVTDGVDDRVVSRSFTLNKDWTIVGNWKMLQPEANKSSGIVKQNSLFIYNHVDGLNITINDAWNFFKLKDIRSVNAICSDGRIYLNDWTEIIDSKQQTVNESVGTLVIGILGNVYTSLAFKNLGIYNNQILSKDDCIKAYNYLQTLKAK